MTVQNSDGRDQYVATAGQTVFPYTFEIVSKDDITVVQNDTILAEGTNYSLTGVGSDTGGNITLAVGATAGDIITTYRSMALERTTDYQNSGDFLAAEVNDDFDRLWLALQQGQEVGSRAIVKPVVDAESINMVLPEAASRFNTFLGFDATGAVTVVPAGDPSSPDSIIRQQFTGNGSTTVFTLSFDAGVFGTAVQLYVDGVHQTTGTYTVSGTALTFTEAPPVDAGIEVVFVRVTEIGETDASLVSYFPAGTGAVQTTVQTKLRESVSVKDFGAVGDGVTDDTAAIQAALTFAGASKGLEFPEATYIFDAVLTLNKVISNNATLKLKSSASVTGGIRDNLITVAAGAILEGRLTVDCNKASNAAAPPTNGTVPGVGVLLAGGGHNIEYLKVINSWSSAINDVFGNMGNVGNSTIGTLEADNCGGGIFIEANNQPTYINKISVTNTNSEYTGNVSHGLDVFHMNGGYVREILIDGCDGTTASVSIWFSGLTTKGNTNAEFNKITIQNMVDNNPSQLVPLAWSNLSAVNCLFENFHIKKFSENRHLEMTGMQGCTVRKGSIIADFNESYTSGAVPANTNGIIITDDTVDSFESGRDHGASTDNLFEDIFMENMGYGVKDGGLRNTFRSVRAYGSLTHGYISQYVNENSLYYAPLANPIYGGALIDGCDFSYSNQAGIVITADSRPMRIVNTRTVGNGKDSTATAVNKTGIRYDVIGGNLLHKVINHSGHDDAADLVTTNLFSAEEGNVFSDTRTFPCTKLDGGHNLRAGMRFVLTNAKSGTTDIPVRVEHASAAFDSFDVRPSASGASGTIQNGGNSARTGTFSGSTSSRTITGVGSALRTEVTGKCYVTVNGELLKVAGVSNDTTLLVEDFPSATFSGQAATLHVSSSTATTALQGTATSGSQLDVQGMTFYGNASGAPTGGLTIGAKDRKSINVAGSSSGVVTFDTAFPEIPFVVACSNSSVASSVSVVRTSKTTATVYNGAAFAVNISVFADY